MASFPYYDAARLLLWNGAYPVGALGDGTTDDTSAFTAAFVDANTRRVPLLIPPGTFKLTSGFDLAAFPNVSKILGAGPGLTKLQLENPTVTLFSFGAYSGNRDDLELGGFTVDSSVTRTAGWIFQWAPAYTNATSQVLRRARIHDLVMLHQYNGLQLGTYEYDWLDNVLYDYPGGGSPGATAFKIGQTAATNIVQGSEIYLQGCQANNRASGASALSYGFWFEDCDAVYLNACGSIASVNNFTVTNTGHGCANFFWNQVVSDGTAAAAGNHSTIIKGANANQRFQIVNSWFASAGRGGGTGAADGLHINAGAAFDWTIASSNFYNCGQYGLYTKDFIGKVVGCRFSGNATKDLFVDASGAGALCGEFDENLVLGTGWQTAATAARCAFRNNYYLAAPVYGVAPAVNLNNVTY